MAVRALLDAVGTWNIFDLLDPPPHVAKRLAEITEAERAELIEALPPAARACATDGKLSDMPNFMPRGNPYNRTGCEAFQLPGWLVGKLGLPDGLPVFRELFAGDPNLDVRLAAGHFALMYPGTAAEIADGAVARASERIGWFRLWVGAQLALARGEAFVAVADRIATSAKADVVPRLQAAMDAAWHAAVDDPRWGDLAMMMLEHQARHASAIRILSRLRDRRVVPTLLGEIAHPDHGTSSAGLDNLARVLDEAELLEQLGPMLANPAQGERLRATFERHGLTTGLERLAQARAARAAEVAAQARPFLFFGARPADWYEGANGGHLYIVGFAGRVTAAGRNRFERALAGVAPERWRWGELDGKTWVYFYCGGEPFDELQSILTRVHRTVRIREVIFGGLREELDGDDWTAWSHAQRTAAKRVPALMPDLAYDMIHYLRDRELVQP